MLAEKPDFRRRVRRRFHQQRLFTAGYSPLFSRLCGIVEEWLDDEDDPVTHWLLRASRFRPSFEVPLLLMAGLHRSVLAGSEHAQELAAFFPTAGGLLGADNASLRRILRQTMLAEADELTTFLGTASVQTNETGRGFCWLLPLLYTPWQQVHLVDLGASAGLNLVADKRSYTFKDGDSGRDILVCGTGKGEQFIVSCSGRFIPPPCSAAEGRVVSRTGCDRAPFILQSKDDELTLSSFIWGDQGQRLVRLQQGIEALYALQADGNPVHVYEAELPGELDSFLFARIPLEPGCPVLLYNTYLTNYLDDRGASLRASIERWAALRNYPVLWLQMELSRDPAQAPHRGWVLWQAELWQEGDHHQWRLAWAHPHGSSVRWLPDWGQWARFWQQQGYP